MSDVQVLLAEPGRPSEIELWTRLLEPMGCSVIAPKSTEEDELAELIRDATALIVRRRKIDESLIAQSVKLKLIQKIGLKTENIDVGAARSQGVQVKTAMNPSWLGVAEHAVALIFALAKQLRNADIAVRDGVNPQQVPSQTTTETSYAYNWAELQNFSLVHGRSLGLVGMGEISQLVAERASALGMHVQYTRKRGPDSEANGRGYTWRSFEDLVSESDFVSLHVPLTNETTALLGETEFRAMKSSAYLINTSRGGVVDQDALVYALSSGEIAGAGLDVFREEPLPADHPLTGLDNVILSPHSAAVRPETLDTPFPEVVNNIKEASEVFSL